MEHRYRFILMTDYSILGCILCRGCTQPVSIGRFDPTCLTSESKPPWPTCLAQHWLIWLRCCDGITAPTSATMMETLTWSSGPPRWNRHPTWATVISTGSTPPLILAGSATGFDFNQRHSHAPISTSGVPSPISTSGTWALISNRWRPPPPHLISIGAELVGAAKTLDLQIEKRRSHQIAYCNMLWLRYVALIVVVCHMFHLQIHWVYWCLQLQCFWHIICNKKTISHLQHHSSFWCSRAHDINYLNYWLQYYIWSFPSLLVV
jgi:hypothetical protein